MEGLNTTKLRTDITKRMKSMDVFDSVDLESSSVVNSTNNEVQWSLIHEEMLKTFLSTTRNNVKKIIFFATKKLWRRSTRRWTLNTDASVSVCHGVAAQRVHSLDVCSHVGSSFLSWYHDLCKVTFDSSWTDNAEGRVGGPRQQNRHHSGPTCTSWEACTSQRNLSAIK